MKNIENKQKEIEELKTRAAEAAPGEASLIETQIAELKKGVEENEKKLAGKGLGARALTNTVNMTLPSSISGAKNYGSLVSKDFTKNATRTVGKEGDFTDEKIKGSVDKTFDAVKKEKERLEKLKKQEKTNTILDKHALALLMDRTSWHTDTPSDEEFKALETETLSLGRVSSTLGEAKQKIKEQQGLIKTKLKDKALPEAEKSHYRNESRKLSQIESRLSVVHKKYSDTTAPKEEKAKGGDKKEEKKDDKGGKSEDKK